MYFSNLDQRQTLVSFCLTVRSLVITLLRLKAELYENLHCCHYVVFFFYPQCSLKKSPKTLYYMQCAHHVG